MLGARSPRPCPVRRSESDSLGRRALLVAFALATLLPPGWEQRAHAQSGLDRPSSGNPDLDREPAFDDEPAPRRLPTPPPPARLVDRIDDPGERPPERRPDDGQDLRFPGADEPIVEVRIEGNVTIPESAISRHIHTRPDRPASEKMIREDVRSLYNTRWFFSVEPRFVRSDEGLVLVFQVLERPIVQRVEYRGRKKIKEKYLAAETGLKVGSPFDVSANREAARRIEAYYHEKGHAFATVELEKGGDPNDREVVFFIQEGPKVRVTSVKFDGNDHFSDGLLATKLQTKRAILWLFGGKYDPATIPDDVAALKQYYHSLGYFDVKVDHRVAFSENRARAQLEYIVDEGTRYKVRDIHFSGNRIFDEQQLRSDLKLTSGQYFNSRFLDKDLDGIKGKYGETGRLFARVEAVPRFLAAPGEADLVYNIDEDKPYTIGRINVQFNHGDDSHTKRSVVLNTITIQPGDLANQKILKKSERRLGGSGIFEGHGPEAPKISISRRDEEDPEDEYLRGQSPSPRYVPTSGRAPLWPRPEDDGPIPEGPGRHVAPVPTSLPPRQLPHPPPVRVSPTSVIGPTSMRASAANPTVVTTVRPAPPPSDPQPPLPRDRSTLSAPVYTIRAKHSAAPEVRSDETAATRPDPDRILRPVVRTPSEILPFGEAAAPREFGQVAVVSDAPDPSDSSTPDWTLRTTWESVDPREAFREPNPNFVLRAQNAFDGPIEQPGNPIIQNSPQGDPFNNRLPEPMPGIVDLNIDVTEARTGRLMFGVGVNSDAGVVGSIVLTEQNFDILRPPTSFRDLMDGTAWRGAGQKFRLEAVPGNIVSRYLVSWTDPFFLDSPYSLGVSGFYYNRFLPDWTEERAGGRVQVGRQLTPTLSVSGAIRLENVVVSDPDFPTPPILREAVGSNFLSTGRVSIAHDTRDAPFLPGEGHYINLSYEQAFGDFDYPRFESEASQYFTLFSRPDGGGRQILALSSQVAWTDNDTPVFERFFAGGYQTFRGFAFRGVGPKEGNVRVGGTWMAIGSVEYMFPILANEMVRLVAFSDFGTVEDSVGFDDFRLTVGAGFRVTVPAMGPVPLAFDWGVPILKQDEDDTRLFSFYVGVTR